MVVRTGGQITNKRIATAALRKGYQFHAYGKGFTTPQGEIVCHSERDVFEVVGLPWQEPWERVGSYGKVGLASNSLGVVFYR